MGKNITINNRIAKDSYFKITISFIILFYLFSANYKVLHCEEVITIPITVLEDFKKMLVEKLLELVKQEDFLKSYGQGHLFASVCHLKSFYLFEFVDKLPLNDILLDKNIKTADDKTTYILELFYQNILLKQKVFDYRVVLFYQYVLVMYCKATNATMPVTLTIIITGINDLLALGVNVTESIPLIKEGTLKIFSDLGTQEKGLGLTFNVEGDSNSIFISFSIDSLSLNKPTVLSESPIAITFF